MHSVFRSGLIVAAALVAAVQLVPYGRNHTNPAARVEPAWDRPETRDLARRACFDCHSNETVWPWYSHVAPASWLVQRDVEKGRHELNFSEWNRPQEEADEAVEMVRKGKMPLKYYLPAHPRARLSDAEREALVAGLTATIGARERGRRAHGESEDDD